MELKVTPKPVVEKSSTPAVQQTSYWGLVKQKQGFQSHAFDLILRDEPLHGEGLNSIKAMTDDLLMVMRRVSHDMQIAYVPYGPKILPQNIDRGQYLEELSENLRPFMPADCRVIRYDLPWQSPYVNEGNVCRSEPPETRVQEMRMNFCTCHKNFRKAPTDILPTTTLFIDLENDQETLLKKMKPKTRYNIRLARRRGVEVKRYPEKKLNVWYELYKETAARNGINNQGIDYFQPVLNTRGRAKNNTPQAHLLMAESDGNPLAGMVLVISGKRATYLYGASTSHQRKLMPSYALQWEAIRLAQKAGCSEYDMFGISPTPNPAHPMYGLYRFKTGFGGSTFRRQGCWDYPLDEEWYQGYRIAEMNSPGFHSS